jgi:hypothetical protein
MKKTTVTAKRNQTPSLSTPSATDAKIAEATATEYAESGIGSNRTNRDRLAVILAVFYCVTRTGNACALPAIAGDSPTYNRAWRAVRSALSESEWETIKVCAVAGGEFTTTAKNGTAYLVPAGTKTKGIAPQGW